MIKMTNCKECGIMIPFSNKTGHCNKHYRNHVTYTDEMIARFRRGGINSSQQQKALRRSKNEIYFAELCGAQFNVKLNEPMSNGWDADVILIEQKVAVLWNGKWHYQQIGNSRLQQIQNRDKIKLGEIEKSGYLAYIIKDMGKRDDRFVQVQFARFNKWLDKIT